MWRYIVTVKTSGDGRREVAGGGVEYLDVALVAAMKHVDAERISHDDVTRVVIYRSN